MNFKDLNKQYMKTQKEKEHYQKAFDAFTDKTHTSIEFLLAELEKRYEDDETWCTNMGSRFYTAAARTIARESTIAMILGYSDSVEDTAVDYFADYADAAQKAALEVAFHAMQIEAYDEQDFEACGTIWNDLDDANEKLYALLNKAQIEKENLIEHIKKEIEKREQR